MLMGLFSRSLNHRWQFELTWTSLPLWSLCRHATDSRCIPISFLVWFLYRTYFVRIYRMNEAKLIMGTTASAVSEVTNTFWAKVLCSRLPINLMRNRGQEKESMIGASGFAEVELKLSKTLHSVKVCLIYFLLFTFIWNIWMLFCHIQTVYSAQQRIRHTIQHFSRYLISTVKQLLNGLIRQLKIVHFLAILKTVTLWVPIDWTELFIQVSKHRK